MITLPALLTDVLSAILAIESEEQTGTVTVTLKLLPVHVPAPVALGVTVYITC